MVRETAGILLLIAAGVLTACKSGVPAAGPSPASDGTPTLRVTPSSRRLLSSDNGLEVRTWVIMDRGPHIADAIASFGQPALVDASADASLRRNGLRLVRIRADELESLLASLGGASLDATTWHGQIYHWRELVQYPIGPAGMAVAVDGLVRRFESGTFRLMFRSWTVPMEDGPRLQLQLLGQFDRPQQDPFRRFVTDRRVTGEVFHSFAFQIQLEVGFGYALLFESPSIDWSFGPAEQHEASAEPVAAESNGQVPDPEQVGPKADAPPTFGELLLRTGARPPKRRMLVFVPKFPPAAFPPDTVGAASDGHRP
ncbi:MAG: hypothetical protein IIA64_03155 [Planctomycetes bacterium]|nr:hypothetical protein [Planctomycetota bacterium]